MSQTAQRSAAAVVGEIINRIVEVESEFVRELAFLRRVSWTLELESVSVRVVRLRDPHAVAHKRPLAFDSPRLEFPIEGDRVLADKANGNANAKLVGRHIRVTTRLPELLEHQSGAAELEPAPLELAIWHPFDCLRESEPIDVVANRSFDVVDHEERYRLLDVRLGCRRRCHCKSLASLESESLSRGDHDEVGSALNSQALRIDAEIVVLVVAAIALPMQPHPLVALLVGLINQARRFFRIHVLALHRPGNQRLAWSITKNVKSVFALREHLLRAATD